MKTDSKKLNDSILKSTLSHFNEAADYLFQLRDSFRSAFSRQTPGKSSGKFGSTGRGITGPEGMSTSLGIIDDHGMEGQLSQEESIEALRSALAEKDSRSVSVYLINIDQISCEKHF